MQRILALGFLTALLLFGPGFSPATYAQTGRTALDGVPDWKQFTGTWGPCYSGCLPTATAQALAYWAGHGYDKLIGANGEQAAIIDLRTRMGTTCGANDNTGWTKAEVQAEIMAYASAKGYSFNAALVYPGEANFQRYRAEIDAGHPVVVTLSPDPAHRDFTHTTVGFGYDASDQTMIIYDNWPGSAAGERKVAFSTQVWFMTIAPQAPPLTPSPVPNVTPNPVLHPTISGPQTGSSLQARLNAMPVFPIVEPGKTVQVEIVLLNSGNQPWPAGVTLAQTSGSASLTGSTEPLAQPVPPGGQGRWSVKITGPAQPGVYSTLWQATAGGTRFGYPAPILVVVTPKGADAGLDGVIRRTLDEAQQEMSDKLNEQFERAWADLERKIQQSIQAELDRQVNRAVSGICGSVPAAVVFVGGMTWWRRRWRSLAKQHRDELD